VNITKERKKMKCDFCSVETEVTEDALGYHHCAYCAAVYPYVKDYVGREWVRQVQCLCAVMNVLHLKKITEIQYRPEQMVVENVKLEELGGHSYEEPALVLQPVKQSRRGRPRKVKE
jgi:hypothetical protein